MNSSNSGVLVSVTLFILPQANLYNTAFQRVIFVNLIRWSHEQPMSTYPCHLPFSPRMSWETGHHHITLRDLREINEIYHYKLNQPLTFCSFVRHTWSLSWQQNWAIMKVPYFHTYNVCIIQFFCKSWASTPYTLYPYTHCTQALLHTEEVYE